MKKTLFKESKSTSRMMDPFLQRKMMFQNSTKVNNLIGAVIGKGAHHQQLSSSLVASSSRGGAGGTLCAGPTSSSSIVHIGLVLVLEIHQRPATPGAGCISWG